MKRSAAKSTTIAIALAMFLPSPLWAGDLLYAAIVGEFDAVWAFDSDPIPDHSDSQWFILKDVDGNYGSTFLADIQFFSWGGLRVQDSVTDALLFEAIGPLLFSGSTSAPHFTIGSYTLTSVATGAPVEMWITYVPEALPFPEPGTWALMIGGFGLVGTSLRRRKLQPA